MSAAFRKKKKKDSPLQKILKSKIFQGIVVILVLIIIFRFAKKAAMFLIFTIITYQITYYAKLYHLPFDISPLFFLECVITKFYGLNYTMLFILLSYLVPKALVGGLGNWQSYVFLTIGIIGNLPFILFPSFDLFIGGMIANLILYIGGIIGQNVLMGKNVFICISDGVANIMNNVVWFLIFSDLINWIFL